MKFISFQKLTLIALSSLFFTGCGGIGSEPINATTGGFVLGNFGSTLVNVLPQSNTVPQLPINGLTTSLLDVSSRSLASCETVTPASIIDADNDNIAAYKKYSFDCVNSVDNGYSYTRKGTVEIRDKDESVAGMFGGIRVDYNVPTFRSTSLASGTTYEYSYAGFWDYSNQGGSLISNSSYSGSSKYGYNNMENDYSYTASWNYKMTPKSTVSPWDEGSLEIEGSYILSGKFIREDISGNHSQQEGSWTISYKTKDLTFKTGCSKFYQSGSYIMTDSANNMEIVYNCNSAKLYVNGVESNWWQP